MKNNNRVYIIPSFSILVAVVLIIFCIFPLLNQIKKSSDDLVSAKNGIAILGAQTIETENFKSNYASYKTNFDKMDQLFIDPSNPVNFIKFLEDTAAGCKITSQISLPPSSQQPGTDSIIFQFSSKGTFAEMMDFSKKIESGPYLIEIENLTIQNSSADQGNGIITGSQVGQIKDYSSQKVDAAFTIKVFTKK